MEKSAILDYIKAHPGSSSGQIADALANEMSLATVKRILSEYVKDFYVYTEGRARATK